MLVSSDLIRESAMTNAAHRNGATGAAWLLLLCSVVLLGTAACSPTTPTAASDCPAGGALRAEIDGVAWTAACVQAFRDPIAAAYIEVVAASGDRGEVLTFRLYASAPGTYPVGGADPPPPGRGSSAGLIVGCHPRPGSCPGWYVAPCCGQPDGNGSGEVTLTALTAIDVAGSFSFDMVASRLTGAVGSKIVTNGRFNVRF
jgi:hypothetical protein